MRFAYTYFLVLFSLTILFTTHSLAQEAPLSAPLKKADQAQESDGSIATTNEPSVTEKSVFETATDAQIEEAQSFYDRCTSNATMNREKDCKCASVAYLETRMKLGEEATAEDIMAQNVDTCLTNPEESAAGNATDLSEVTGEQIQESQAVYEHCKASTKLSREYDCECFAAEFLDKRLELGPLPSWDYIFLSLKNDCRNIVATTGYEYSRCMARFGNTPPEGVEPIDFCECYARRWADLLESFKGNVNNRVKSTFRSRARGYCGNPEVYNNKPN